MTDPVERPPYRTIADLRIGDTAWTVPWAMRWTKDGAHCLRPDYSAENSPGGTVQMRITRTTDGFHVSSNVDADRRAVEFLTDVLPVVRLEKIGA